MTFIDEFLQAMLHIISAPFRDASVLWQLIPILLVLFVLGGYFVLWHERLGWNSALTNALTLFWVVMTSMQVIFGDDTLFSWTKFIAFSSITLYTFFLLVIVFRHRYSDRVTFAIANPLLIHYTGMIVVLWAHGLIVFSPMVFFAMLALFVLFNLVHLILGSIFGHEVEELTERFSAQTTTLFQENQLPTNTFNQQETASVQAPLEQFPQPTYRHPVQNFQRRTF